MYGEATATDITRPAHPPERYPTLVQTPTHESRHFCQLDRGLTGVLVLAARTLVPASGTRAIAAASIVSASVR
jgi:hypothetical protein